MSSLKHGINPRKDLRAREYWRSLGDLAQTPEFLELMQREFPAVATEAIEPTSRRGFLKLMGASLALAGLGLSGCRWPVEKITPFSSNPAGYTVGRPMQYATALDLGGAATGLIVTSYEGRPIKIEGNPHHSGSLGAANVWHQASVLDLYDPDRSKRLIQHDAGQTVVRDWDAFATFAKPHFAGLGARGGQGLAVLAEPSSSPSQARLKAALSSALPSAQWYEYAPVSRDNERDGLRLIFGAPYRPQYQLARARVIASFADDWLYFHPNAVRLARDFATHRRADDGTMSRLYVTESALSVTGAQADHRLAVKPSRVGELLAMLLAELFLNQGLTVPGNSPALSELLDGKGALEHYQHHADKPALIATMAQDLLANRGRSLVTVGPDLPPVAHALAHLINHALGNTGQTVAYSAEPEAARLSHGAALPALVQELEAGAVDTLVILGGNPVYASPAGAGLAAALTKAKTVIHLGHYYNETARLSSWHLPQAHYLEAWGDAWGWDGTLSVVQPLIEPFYGGKSPLDLLALMLNSDTLKAYDIVRETLQPVAGGADFEAFWRQSLHDGVVAGSAWPQTVPGADYTLAAPHFGDLQAPPGDGFEALILPDTKIYDGRFANNGWLQELPDPLTKLTWSNAALISPASAAQLGLVDEAVVRVKAGGAELDLPVLVLPGIAAGTVVLSLGYGRGTGETGEFGGNADFPNIGNLAKRDDYSFSPVGRVGDGVGANVYGLLPAWPGGPLAVTLERTGRQVNLATTQDHHLIDTLGFKERGQRVGPLVREANLDFFHEHPEFATEMGHHPPLKSLWQEYEFDGHRWGLAIDLSACIGCGACITACQAENNIPVVGPERVREGREMQWIRVDRYFKGEPEAPQVAYQPVACQQCELAPCESVCPVAATIHSEEGLNDMVYNRCVGTRYCSNNCPYKVRRFNFFNYRKNLTETEKLQYNPEVTIRSRGVMEKCTYCVQRIQHAKIQAKNEQRPLKDGEIVPACAQTCPAQAIVFGDLSDPASAITQQHQHERAYALLAELNNKPRTAYLARLRNPAPGTPEYDLPQPVLHLSEAKAEQTTEEGHH